MKARQIALMLLGTLTLPVAAADINSYRFLSGGATMDRDGLVDTKIKEGFKDIKVSSLGGYVHGSYDFDNQIFIEANTHYLKGRQLGFFAKLGYYFPIDENSNFYLLGGIGRSGQLINSKKNTKTEEPKTIDNPLRDVKVTAEKVIVGGVELPDPTVKTITVTDTTETEKEINVKARLAPMVELGYKMAFNERLGIRAALQSSYDNLLWETKNTSKIDWPSTGERKTLPPYPENLSEKRVSVGLALSGQYTLTEQLTLEAGYSWSRCSPPKKLKLKSTGIHRGQLGLRYLF